MAASNDDQLDGDWGSSPPSCSISLPSLDVTVDVRLAACSKTLCRHVADNMNLHHWDGPCLPMPDSAHWHYDDSSAHHTVYHVVPLDHPRRTAILPFMDNRFWVGMNGDWIAGVDNGGNWFLANIYTHQEISLPSSETCNIFREEWIGFPDLPPESVGSISRGTFFSAGSTIWLGTDFPGGGTSFSGCADPNPRGTVFSGGGTTKRCWRGKGRPKRVGHSADPPQPSRFYVQLDGNDDMYMLVIPREFKQCLKGILPRPIKLKTSVGCAWYVHIDEYQGELVLKDGWFGFAEAHELQLDDLLVFECSNKKLKLGESLSWKETSVEPAPVCKVFGRIDEENTPDSFCKVLCTSELEVISIPSRVLPWFYGGCPESINLKMSTACTWIVDLKQQDGNVLMDKGWPEFVKAHDLKVGYLLTFKKLDTKSLQVLIFGYNCCEKVIWCSGYHPSLGQQYQSQLY
ncbi:hypothetical protein QYE76_016346 [Lolium multiflorum]|uniref:TF-B3 domain-containing protein n=1 Tax=Lolium multiflorum TaxID=4521 RepID=A0AAD8VEK6_LOLMU|nr:hypothetical protein QYE76_016346 [Lolium multiflorum]